MVSRARVRPPQPSLTDGVVRLRAPVEGDLARIHEDGQDAQTQRWVNVPQPYTLEAARGRGIGRRAVVLATTWAFDALGAARVEARTDPENLASQRLLEKAGFTPEGVERSSREVNGHRYDMRCWARLPGDPAPDAGTR